MPVDETRPFEPTGMDTAAWRRLPEETVRLADLTLSQHGVTIAGLLHHASGGPSWCGDPIPHVVEHAGRLHLVDGHHRVALALLAGRRLIVARVLR